MRHCVSSRCVYGLKRAPLPPLHTAAPFAPALAHVAAAAAAVAGAAATPAPALAYGEVSKS